MSRLLPTGPQSRAATESTSGATPPNAVAKCMIGVLGQGAFAGGDRVSVIRSVIAAGRACWRAQLSLRAGGRFHGPGGSCAGGRGVPVRPGGQVVSGPQSCTISETAPPHRGGDCLPTSHPSVIKHRNTKR